MKILNLTFALLLCSVLSSPAPILIRKVSGGGGPTYIIDDGFEGPGFEVAATEVPGDGTITDDDSSAAFTGTYSCALTAGTTTHPYFYYTITDANSGQLDFMFRTSNVSTLQSIGGWRTSTGGAVCLFRQLADGTFSVYTTFGGGGDAATTDTYSIGTWYYVRLIWSDGGTCSVEANATGVFDGAGTDYNSRTGGTTTDATRIQFGSTTLNFNTRYDDIKLQ